MPIEVFGLCNNKLLADIYKNTLSKLNLEDVFDVDLSIVSKDEIKQLNNKFRNVNEATDVLSFSSIEISFPFNKEDYLLDIDYMSGNVFLGEIIICEEIAKAQAEEFGHSLEREVGYLFVHGLLHLFGFDHMEDEEKNLMRQKEEEILSKVNLGR